MPPRCPALQGTLTPFLYPFLIPASLRSGVHAWRISIQKRNESTTHEQLPIEGSHLNPPPTDYSRTIFTDKATVTLFSGNGGHGCISFLREKYIEAGPANGGDGGTGGNVYIQAVRGETSLHKLARRNIQRAGRGKNGQGKTRGGERGDDIVIQVPIGTVVREVERVDPVAIEQERLRLEAGKDNGADTNAPLAWDRSKWLLYPAITPEDIARAEFPRMPRGRKSALAMTEVKAPISLDLNKPMDRPLLLVAGAIGGLGNPHFVTKTAPRPKFATKGEEGVKVTRY
jgi:GTP-binding protein